MMNRFTACLLLLLLPTLPAATVSAQDQTVPSSPELVNVIRLAQEGYADSARTLLKGLLDRTDESSPLYAEGLFVGATIARSGEESRLLFSRVAVMHSTSAWADKALLRLAQLDYGTGDTEAAVTRVTRLITDYPRSSVIPVATLWGARAAFERRDTVTACQWLGRGLSMVGTNVELKNQLEYTRQRCPANLATVAAAETPTSAMGDQTPPPSGNPAGTPPPVSPPAQQPQDPPAGSQPASERPWRIQLAAVSDPAAITRVETAIRRAGLVPFRVPAPGGLTRIQAGSFASREEAERHLPALKAAVGGAPFITRVD